MERKTLEKVFKDIKAGKPAPESVTIDLHVLRSKAYNYITIQDGPIDDDYDTLLVQKVTLNIPKISRDDLVNMEVEGLREKQNQIRAESQAQINNIEGTIQSLLSIEYKPESGNA